MPWAILFRPVGALSGDRVLARYHGTTAELDFLLNYGTCLRRACGRQVKYRLGLSAEQAGRDTENEEE